MQDAMPGNNEMCEESEVTGENKLRHPVFREFRTVRARMVASLSVFLLAVYFGNILLMSVFSDLAAQPISGDGMLTVGILYSVGLMVMGASVGAFYSWWSGRYLDVMRRRALEAFAAGAPGQTG